MVRMGRRLADEQEMPARRPNRLADRLAGVEIVAEMDGIEPCIARSVGGEPAPRRHALAVLLVVPILRTPRIGPHQKKHQNLMSGFNEAEARAPRIVSSYKHLNAQAISQCFRASSIFRSKTTWRRWRRTIDDVKQP
jgi:hypothetical protein